MDEYGLRIPTPSDEWRKVPAKKDTRRWCKGHVGREHVPEIVLSKWPYGRKTCHPASSTENAFFLFRDRHGYICYHQVNCSVCGKTLFDTPERCPLNVTS